MLSGQRRPSERYAARRGQGNCLIRTRILPSPTLAGCLTVPSLHYPALFWGMFSVPERTQKALYLSSSLMFSAATLTSALLDSVNTPSFHALHARLAPVEAPR
ncbi:hypothetical protein L227DRAFT_354646 [Lentinus tigrinus ALCF2SS1-6]|uniref:Uncharacterized protein n=1 Tax=Lentinus tigrinus ALCF2SS1-6 TaxID=1328759 RepID=A0A5C2RRM3_9APHY|nr:hypothetical protein L227DRAFT_354646 [Lentinus tigrinus ALCF2SS1-6]